MKIVIKLQILLVCVASALLVLLIGMSTPALAAQLPSSGPVNMIVKGGELAFSVGTPSSPVSTPVGNSMQEVSYTIPVTVVDATGLGNGWSVRLATNSEVFSQAASSSFVTSIAASSTGSLPINTVSYNGPIALGTDTTPIFTATHDTGMGIVTLNVNVSVILPANLSINNYSGNLAFALSSGQAW